MQLLLAKIWTPIKRWEFALIVALALVALVPRLIFLSAANFSIESDEAIVGLMARHMTQGAELPIFYYGQHYMGSLEPMLVALLFLIIGESNQALKLVPLIFSLIHVVLVYLLARRFVRWQFASCAALLSGLAPATLLLWSAKARGGFIELVALGTLSLLLACDCLNPKTSTRSRFLLLGLVLGLGWWVNNQIVFYMLPIATVFLLYFPMQLGLAQSFRFALTSLAGFFIGSAPFWYANLFLSPRFATFKMLFGSSAGGDFWNYLQGFFSTALPIIIGARRFWSEQDVLLGASVLMCSVYAFVFLSVLFLPSKEKKSFAATALLFAFCLSVPLVFSASSFGWLSKAPRYLLPLYSVIFVVVAMSMQRLWDFGARGTAVIIGIVLLFAHGVSGFWGGVAIAGEPIVYKGQRVAKSHAVLYSWLKENNYSHIYTNYWIGYRAAFETGEQVTFSRYGHPKTLRIPEYELRAKSLDLAKVYVLVPGEAQLLGAELTQFGYSYRKSNVGEYVVIDRLKPVWPRGEKLELNAEQVTVFNRAQQRINLFDGDSSSRWGSGMPQHPGMQVSVDLAGVELVSGIEIEFGNFVHDAPRDLEIIGVQADGSELVLFRLYGTKTYYELQAQATSEVEPVWSIYFAPKQLRKIIFRQHATTKLFDWSMAELRVFRPGN